MDKIIGVIVNGDIGGVIHKLLRFQSRGIRWSLQLLNELIPWGALIKMHRIRFHYINHCLRLNH